jgi:hypothetical protein
MLTKKEIVLLLSPNIFFAVIAVAAFFTSGMILQKMKDDGHKQNFETFASNVQSGKLQPTTSNWLENLRHKEVAFEALRQACIDFAEIFRDFMWAALGGIFLQTAITFSVIKHLRKRNNDKSQSLVR